MPLPDPIPAENTLEVLLAAREWLADQKRWTTSVLWRAADGEVLAHDTSEIHHCDRNDVAYACASGALALVASEFPDEAADALSRYLPMGIVQTNDGPRGYARIMAAYDQVIEELCSTT